MKNRKPLFIIFFAAFILQAFLLTALPETAGFVTDEAGVISAEDKRIIEAVASEIKSKSGAEVAVLTVKTFEPYGSIEEFAIDTASKWGIGEKGKDNGVLIVVSTGERKLRIEVGYGLEGAIPDGLAGTIMDKYMVPYLRNNDFSTGLKNGFIAVSSVVAREYNFEIEGSEFHQSAEAVKTRKNGSQDITILVVLIIFIMSGGRIFWPLLFLSAASGRRGRYSGGGGFGSGFGSSGGFSGGFGGFGGGGFGGGGSSRGF